MTKSNFILKFLLKSLFFTFWVIFWLCIAYLGYIYICELPVRPSSFVIYFYCYMAAFPKEIYLYEDIFLAWTKFYLYQEFYANYYVVLVSYF
jgi:hypothetical protein